jgi:hypothetical protein
MFLFGDSVLYCYIMLYFSYKCSISQHKHIELDGVALEIDASAKGFASILERVEQGTTMSHDFRTTMPCLLCVVLDLQDMA